VPAAVRGSRVRRCCLLYALLSAAIGLLWQSATVYRNYQGNWTALFCIGALSPFPDLPAENIYRFANSRGFDGQFYYLIAHNPSPTGALATDIDTPDLRYERILVPVLAYAGALGNPKAVALSYIGENLLFLFLGSWWIGMTMALRGASPAWGLAFLLIPAVPISLDRMTVDLALVALMAGVFYFHETNQLKKMFVAMALLCLTRETGAVIVAAFVAWFLIRRRWKPALGALMAALPFAAWLTYVLALHPLRVHPWVPDHPFRWTWAFLFHPPPYPFSPATNLAVRLLDVGALAGLGLAIVAAALRAHTRTEPTGSVVPLLKRGVLSPARIASLFFSGLAVYLLSLDEWTHVYDFGRVLSPLALILLMDGVTSRTWWLVAPACLMTLRVAVQLAPQVLGIVLPHA
jgi:hypothetical protein